MRKRYAIILLAITVIPLVAWLFFACQRKKEETPLPVTITYWTHQDEARAALEQELIAQFIQRNPDVRINRVEYTSSEMIDLIPRAFAAGQGPDMFNLPVES